VECVGVHVSERKTRRRHSRKGFRNVEDGQAIRGEESEGWGMMMIALIITLGEIM